MAINNMIVNDHQFDGIITMIHYYIIHKDVISYFDIIFRKYFLFIIVFLFNNFI